MSSTLPSRSVVLSVICLHPVGVSSLSVAEKVIWQQQFNALLGKLLAGVLAQDRVVLPLGDGVSISFLRDPECALTVALRLQGAMSSGAFEAMPVGINLGSMQFVENSSGMPSLFGEGISIAESVMRAASNGDILVSRSFYESVSYLSADHKAVFSPAGGYMDRDGRHCELLRLGTPSPQLQARLESLWVATGPSVAVEVQPAAVPLTTQQHVLKTISNWFSPFNVLVTFVGLSITGLERLVPGGSLTRIGFFVSISIASILAILFLLQTMQWPRWYWTRPGAMMRTLASRSATVLVGLVAAMFGVGVLVLSPEVPESSAALPVNTTPKVSISTSASTVTPLVAPILNPAVVAGNVSAPTVTSISTAMSPVMAEPVKTSAKMPSASSSMPSVQQAVTKTKASPSHPAERHALDLPVPQYKKASVQNDKCSEIVMRSSVGIPLTDNDRELLRTQCR